MGGLLSMLGQVARVHMALLMFMVMTSTKTTVYTCVLHKGPALRGPSCWLC